MIASSVGYGDELLRQLFFLSAAGLGALFAVLYPLTSTVAAGEYDENDDASYVTRVVVGLVAGTILGQLVNVSDVAALGGLTRPTLAVLGGFSASLVFKVLSGLVQGIESVFSSAPQARGDAGTGTVENRNLRVVAERQAVVAELLDIQLNFPPGSPQFSSIGRLIERIIAGDIAP